jgi:DNA polymerase III subunit delta'
MNMLNKIYGQERVKGVIKEIITSGKVPHAILFQGQEGVGKDYMAIAFAYELNNYHFNGENDYLSEQILQLSEPYLKYIFPLPRGKNEKDDSGPLEKLSEDEIGLMREEMQLKRDNPYHKISLPKANIIKISSIRDIKKFVSFNYSDIKYRCIIISDAHLMNEEAQNALLKNLEEPPEGIIFILTTPYPNLLRETIRSRCWNIVFQPLTIEDTEDILVKNFNVEPDKASKAALFSDGSVTEALKLLTYDIEELLDRTILILRFSLGRKYHSAFDQFKPVTEESDSELLKLLVKMIIYWLNDVQKEKYNVRETIFVKHRETIEKFIKKFPDIQSNECIVKLDSLTASLKNNVNINIIISNIVFTLAELTLSAKKSVYKS